MLLRQVTFNSVRPPQPIRVRCPGCRDRVTLDVQGSGQSAQDLQLQSQEPVTTFGAGQRLCPNRECGAHLFVLYDVTQGQVLAVYTAERIDFDATGQTGGCPRRPARPSPPWR